MNTELIYAIALGIGLSACCGFRVFVPLFLTSALSYLGRIDIVPGFDWMNTLPAVILFGVASLVELVAYYIPIVDHALDVIATPLSVAAGALLSASFMTDLPPMLQWGLGIIVGGGAAGSIQLGTTMTRYASTGLTAGLGNPVIATAENIMSVLGSLVAFLLPILTAVCLLLLGSWLSRKMLRKYFSSKSTTGNSPTV